MVIERKKLKVDSRGRISIKQLVSDEVTSFRAKLEENGTIVLEPIVDIEIHPEEAWIYKNPEVKSSLERGLEDFEAGRVSKLDENFWDEVDAMSDEEE